MASPRGQSMDSIAENRLRAESSFKDFSGSDEKDSDDYGSEGRGPSINEKFDYIDKMFAVLREELSQLEDKLGPYLRHEPVPGDSDMNKAQQVSSRSEFYETLERYPIILDRIIIQVRSLAHRVDR